MGIKYLKNRTLIKLIFSLPGGHGQIWKAKVHSDYEMVCLGSLVLFNKRTRRCQAFLTLLTSDIIF